MEQRVELDEDLRGLSSQESEEDLPILEIKSEDKPKIIKSIILLLLYYSVIIYSLIYCNSPNSQSNLLLENYEDEEVLFINNFNFVKKKKKISFNHVIFLFREKDNKINNIILSLEYQFLENYIDVISKLIEYYNYNEKIIKKKNIRFLKNQLNNKIEDISLFIKQFNITKNINLTELFE